MAVTFGESSISPIQGSGTAARIVGGTSPPAQAFDIGKAGPQILDWLRTRLDLSMVADSPVASRYAVSGVDNGGVPLSPGSSSGGSTTSGVIAFNTRTGYVYPQKNDYSVELLSDTDIVSPAVGDVLTYETGGIWKNVAGGGGGSGTVTDFSFTNANGFTGSVTNATTTPNLTLSYSGGWNWGFAHEVITHGITQ